MQDSFIKAGVIGYPVKHSKSPLLHEHWITRHQKQGAYNAIEVPPEKLENMVQDLIDRGYAGFNITLPHKQTIMHLCTDIDDTARSTPLSSKTAVYMAAIPMFSAFLKISAPPIPILRLPAFMPLCWGLAARRALSFTV